MGRRLSRFRRWCGGVCGLVRVRWERRSLEGRIGGIVGVGGGRAWRGCSLSGFVVGVVEWVRCVVRARLRDVVMGWCCFDSRNLQVFLVHGSTKIAL